MNGESAHSCGIFSSGPPHATCESRVEGILCELCLALVARAVSRAAGVIASIRPVVSSGRSDLCSASSRLRLERGGAIGLCAQRCQPMM